MIKDFSKSSPQSGFTLIEVLIAIGILGSLMMMISNMTVNMVTTRAKTESRAGILHGTAAGMAKLYDDLNMAFSAAPTAQGKNNAYLTGFKGTSTELTFSTLNNFHVIKNKVETDSVLVNYKLRPNENRLQDLVRRQSRFLLPQLEFKAPAFVLVPNVKSVAFGYYDSNSKNWLEVWDSTSATAAGRLPELVRLRLTVYGGFVDEEETRRSEHEYEVVVPLPLFKQRLGM